MKRRNWKNSRKRRGAAVFAVLFSICMLCGVAALGVNGAVVSSVSDRILSVDEAAKIESADCILVLGCLVRDNGQPSDMLRDRIVRGVELYHNGTAPKLLMSGDHGRVDYDEVEAMKRVATELGVPSSDVFRDHAGFDTYDSIYRARDVFGADKIIIVTQGYHLYRALFIAESLGIEAYGVSADLHTYRGQFNREVREILARNKDVLSCIFGAKPKYLGALIPIEGNGDET